MENLSLYIQEALNQARMALAENEVPVGAVLVQDGQVIGRGFNSRQRRGVAGHAEIEALEEATRLCGCWRFPGATLVVTLEPCLMCLGALIAARVEKIIYLATDPKAGVLGGMCDLLALQGWNHYPQVVYHEQHQAGELLRQFFKEKRIKEDL